MAVLVVAGCDSTPSLPAATPTETVRASSCAPQRLSVTVDYDGVHVTNTSASTCAFSGRYPVEMNVWRLDGPGPPPAVAS